MDEVKACKTAPQIVLHNRFVTDASPELEKVLREIK